MYWRSEMEGLGTCSATLTIMKETKIPKKVLGIKRGSKEMAK